MWLIPETQETIKNSNTKLFSTKMAMIDLSFFSYKSA